MGPAYKAFLASVAVAGAALIVTGCGRSNIDDYAQGDGGLPDTSTDGPLPDGADGGTCNAATCPTGCCDGQGQCRLGTDIVACGVAGQLCEDCIADGFDQCEPNLKTCTKKTPTCDVSTCPNGCCGTLQGNPTCFSGLSSSACGAGGQQCADCSGKNEVCDTMSHTCVAQGCGPTNCTGCCLGNLCQNGTQDTACGVGGFQCQNCSGMSQFCDQGKCQNVPPKCGPNNCKGCCDGNGQCQAGAVDTQCGTGGGQCQNCQAQQQICTNGACVAPPCGPKNCTGCCGGNACNAGFSNGSCGSGGANCTNCTAMMSTCDTLASPRVCKNQQSTCPAPYGQCPGNVSTNPPPVAKGSCSALDLVDARAACSAGRNSLTCRQFWKFINQQKPGCGKCLSPFDYDFMELTGIYDCVAPYVGAQCNHSTACVNDCVTKSCAQCSMQAMPQCQTQVKQQNGQCLPYVQQTQCIGPALFGPAAFCSPQQYFGNYGAWLQGVGNHYCGP